MSSNRVGELRTRVAALSDVQRRALAERLADVTSHRAAERLVGFVVLDGDAHDDALRAFVGERLPEYMIPARFVALDRLPRTVAGKLDRQALAHAARTEIVDEPSRQARTAPRTELETKLVAIWKDVLKLEDVGVDDDFFEIGGDSLLSIRVIARAGRVGIRIPPERFFERPTISHIASTLDVAIASPNGAHAAIDPVGEAPLAPIQHWFLDAIPDHRDHWNQSYRLELGHALDVSKLRSIVFELVAHHDALRLRLTHHGGRWRQEIPAPNADVPLRVVDLRGAPDARLIDQCEREHASLRLRDGKIFRIVAFERDLGIRELLVLGHHVVLDGVSWQVILEDLATLVLQTVNGQALQLPRKTASARAWAIGLAERAATAAVAASASHWLAMPVDDVDSPAGSNRDAESLILSLGPEASRLFLQDAPRRLDASVQSVLLAALLLAWHDWTGHDTLRLDLEGHGRDVLGDAMDVSRTVGWFTTVFPLHLAIPSGANNGAEPSVEALVSAVQTAVDALPLKGAAHGLARYLAPDESTRAALAAQPRPAVLFNFLGTYDLGLPAASRVRVLDGPSGRPRHPDAARPYSIEINARVEDGALIVAVEYARQARESMERFGASLRDALDAVARGSSMHFSVPGVDASSLAIVADLLAELDEA